MSEAAEHSVQVEREGGVATVTLSRPAAHNALTPEAFVRLATRGVVDAERFEREVERAASEVVALCDAGVESIAPP